jgi:hypothetical protein
MAYRRGEDSEKALVGALLEVEHYATMRALRATWGGG